MADEKQYPQDTEGFEYVTRALMDTLNSYPGLYADEKFKFCQTKPEDGLNVVASSGSFILEEHESITEHIWQICAYPFMVIYRVSGLNSDRKIEAKEWLDTLADWLMKKPVLIDKQRYQMKKWPTLSGDERVERRIERISRNTPTTLVAVEQDKAETWVADLTIQYRQEFDR